jgi:hypothetical protein
MKNNVMRIFLVLGAAAICGTALDAQSRDLLSAKIPFAFEAGGQHFAPGKYVVREHGYSGVPAIQSAKTGQTVFVTGAVHTLAQVSPPKLVFHCYAGATCFLAQIRPSNGTGSTVSMTKAEKEIANGERPREMATIAVELGAN